MPKYETIALVEFRNCAPFVYRITSDKPITVERVAKHLQKTEEWDEVRDIKLADDFTELEI